MGLKVAACAAACVAALAFAPAARAEFVAVAPPCDGSIEGFAASGSTWAAICGGIVRLTRDDGATWAPLSSAGMRASGISAGPDGAFYFGVIDSTDGTGRIMRVDAASGALSTLPMTLPAAEDLSPPAWDAEGRMWVAWRARGQTTLARLTATGVPDLTADGAGLGEGGIEVVPRVSGLFVRTPAGRLKLTGSALDSAQDGIPVIEQGPLIIAPPFVSVDGGAHFELGDSAQGGVDGSDTLLVGGQRRILSRSSPIYFKVTALTVPAGATRVVQTNAGLVAVADAWRDRATAVGGIWLHRGAIPDLPFATGPLSPLFTGWLRRSNSFRAQVGLPPLLGDPAMSRAAENHSRYWTLNAFNADAHGETPGLPGFTGAGPAERCLAAGAGPGCGEILDTNLSDPISDWMASAGHRAITLPDLLSVGGGVSGKGPAVMDFRFDGGLLVGPVLFPSGRYDGALGFISERPDPTAECRAAGQPVSWPLGTAITAIVPSGEVSGLTLKQGSRVLRACVMSGYLLPDEELKPDTTYTVNAIWTLEAGPRPLTWTFTTATGDPGAPPCVPSLERVGARVRKPATVRVRYQACERGSVTLGVYRRSRKLAGRRITLKTSRSEIAELATTRLKPGRYTLRVTLKGAKTKTLKTSVTVLKARRGR